MGQEDKEVQPEPKTLNEKLMQVAVEAIISRIQSERLLTMMQKPVRKVKKNYSRNTAH